MLARKLSRAAVPAILIASLLGSADAAPKRDEKVYQAVEANRAEALQLLNEIVNIDSGTGVPLTALP